MAVNYNPTEWRNNQTPLNQTNMNNIEGGIVRLANAYNGAPFTPDEYNLLRSMIDANYVFTAMRAVADDKGNNIYNSYARKASLTGGGPTQPVYMNNGVVNNCAYTLEASVPADAKFTDTTDLSQMTGVLPVANGGTGGATAAEARTALGLTGAATKSVKDNTSATAIGTSSSLVTERSVYNGLPKINNSHAYTSSSGIFAPTGGGVTGQILISTGGGAPAWANASALTIGNATHAVSADSADTATTAGTATKALQDEDGNNIKATYSKKANTIRNITFNSDGSATITLDNGNVITSTVYGSLADSTWISDTAPTNKKMIWIDSANGYIEKVWSSTDNRWLTPRSVWG